MWVYTFMRRGKNAVYLAHCPMQHPLGVHNVIMVLGVWYVMAHIYYVKIVIHEVVLS